MRVHWSCSLVATAMAMVIRWLHPGCIAPSLLISFMLSFSFLFFLLFSFFFPHFSDQVMKATDEGNREGKILWYRWSYMIVSYDKGYATSHHGRQEEATQKRVARQRQPSAVLLNLSFVLLWEFLFGWILGFVYVYVSIHTVYVYICIYVGM